MTTASIGALVKRYYIRDTLAPFDEDKSHEFKGHRNLAVEELPHWTKERNSDRASRRAASRALNAFLNTGDGGTLYLGIFDSGVVKGLELTLYQKYHILASMEDLMARYIPPVEPHRYSVEFVPVLDQDIVDNEEKIHLYLSQTSSSLANDGPDRDQPHQLRTTQYCWCDKDAVAQHNCGVLPPYYVIEINIRQWDVTDPRNCQTADLSLVNLHPVHEDEEGKVYFRRQASIVCYTINEIAQMTRLEVKQVYTEHIERLKKEIDEHRNKLRKLKRDVT